ncbi:MAG: phosphohistidine phosphatase SixA [Nitrososphaerota archaeon]|jgi:phosphohistidine phosphatase|nr:phosphohistidine phosphatase SixA [Nitrososphaerota archaeon]
MELIILRHGEAGKRSPVSSQDSERSLTASGRDEVVEVAESMRGLKMEFDVIATSPLKRSLETARIVAKVSKKERNLQIWDELKPESDRKALYRRLSNLKSDSSVLLVGHEPYLSSMIGDLISDGRECRVILKKSGLAKVEVSSFAPRPSGELRWLLTPRLIRKVS